MDCDYYIAAMIGSDIKGKSLLLAIKQNIEAKYGDTIAFAPTATKNSREAAKKYYYYRSIINNKGETYLYEQIMRTYNPKTNPGLPRTKDVRGAMCGSKSK